MKRLLVVAGIAAAGLLVGATLLYRASYGTWWQTPSRIHYCSRTYTVGRLPTLSLAQVREREAKTALPGDQPYPVVHIGKVPPLVGDDLSAAVTPKVRRKQLGVPCAMAVYLKTGTDAYIVYGIVGGP